MTTQLIEIEYANGQVERHLVDAQRDALDAANAKICQLETELALRNELIQRLVRTSQAQRGPSMGPVRLPTALPWVEVLA